jgi:mono/diheme cytochrome c family protein
MTTVSNGRNEMPAFGRAMKPEDLHDVATYIVEQLVK